MNELLAWAVIGGTIGIITGGYLLLVGIAIAIVLAPILVVVRMIWR